jgi:hypothetical protein
MPCTFSTILSICETNEVKLTYLSCYGLSTFNNLCNFVVLTMVSIKKIYRCLGSAYCLHLHGVRL